MQMLFVATLKSPRRIHDAFTTQHYKVKFITLWQHWRYCDLKFKPLFPSHPLKVYTNITMIYHFYEKK